jgi:hypothetical protein
MFKKNQCLRSTLKEKGSSENKRNGGRGGGAGDFEGDTLHHGLINYAETKAKCRHQNKVTVIEKILRKLL